MAQVCSRRGTEPARSSLLPDAYTAGWSFSGVHATYALQQVGAMGGS